MRFIGTVCLVLWVWAAIVYVGVDTNPNLMNQGIDKLNTWYQQVGGESTLQPVGPIYKAVSAAMVATTTLLLFLLLAMDVSLRKNAERRAEEPSNDEPEENETEVNDKRLDSLRERCQRIIRRIENGELADSEESLGNLATAIDGIEEQVQRVEGDSNSAVVKTKRLESRFEDLGKRLTSIEEASAKAPKLNEALRDLNRRALVIGQLVESLAEIDKGYANLYGLAINAEAKKPQATVVKLENLCATARSILDLLEKGDGQNGLRSQIANLKKAYDALAGQLVSIERMTEELKALQVGAEAIQSRIPGNGSSQVVTDRGILGLAR